jgi:hypothetical protein
MGVSAECMIVRQADHAWWHVAAALGLVREDTMTGLASNLRSRPLIEPNPTEMRHQSGL